MLIIAIISLSFAALQLIVALLNLLFRQPFPQKNNTTETLISVLIPARNEENNIAHLLSDLKNQDYTNIEVIVFNDQSTDNTAAIVSNFCTTNSRFRLINSNTLPTGWLGKNYACHNLAAEARGNYLLFFDADVRVHNGLLSGALAFMQKHKLALLSIFPHQTMNTPGEKFTVPVMNYILLSLLPLILVRKTSFVSLAAANGQFMLFEATKYHKLLPHKTMKCEKVEDIKIARYYKSKAEPVACVAGNKKISCRMYSNYNNAVEGFSKNIIMFFGNSFFAAIVFWLLTSFGFIFVFITFFKYGLIAWVTATVLSTVITAKVSEQNIVENVLFIPVRQYAMGNIIVKALINKLKKRYIWKGRYV